MCSENTPRLHYCQTCSLIIKCYYRSWCGIVLCGTFKASYLFLQTKDPAGPYSFFPLQRLFSSVWWMLCILTFLNKAQILVMKWQKKYTCTLGVCMHVWVTTMDLQACAIITCWWECKSICKCNSADWLSPSVIFTTRGIQQNYASLAFMRTV